jgi:hypothetical protein
MKHFKQRLLIAGVLSFALAIFQVIIGFSPSLSLYFGAPEILAANIYILIVVSVVIAGILTVFGLYAISGAGCIRTLPWLKQILVVISSIYFLRGLLLVPELLIVMDVIDIAIPVAPRFVLFSSGSLLIGLIYLTGIIGGWHTFSKKK